MQTKQEVIASLAAAKDKQCVDAIFNNKSNEDFYGFGKRSSETLQYNLVCHREVKFWQRKKSHSYPH